MKRGAEKQISKDDSDHEADDSEEQVGTGFVKANDAELATRKIRSLPKRSMLGTPTPTPPTSAPPSVNSSPEQPSKPKFGHFSGFGSTANSSPFTFTSSIPLSGSDSSSSKHLSFNQPSLSTPFTYSNQKSLFGNSNIDDDVEKPRSTSKEDEDYKVELEFYKSMRGLNISFTKFLLRSLEDDPFNDLSQVFEQYQTKQRTIHSIWNNHFKVHSHDHKRDDGPSFLPAGPTMPPAITKSLSPPVAVPPPSSFGELFKQSTSTSASQVTVSPKAGFTPTPEASKASSAGFSFSFPSTPSTSSLPTGPPVPTFALGSSAASSGSTSDSQRETKSTVTFGSSTPESTKLATPFGSSSQSLFGNSSSATTSLFGNSLTPKPKDSSIPTSVFGSSDNSSSFLGFGRSPPSSSGDKSTTPPGTFGAFAGKSFTGFGTATPPSGSGSIGNPVGFGFGGPSKTSSVPMESNSSTGFSFPREPPPQSASTSADISSGTKEGESEEEDHTKMLSPTSVHDQEGEGEEGEETMHSVRSKVFRLNKGEGTTGWTDLGIGMLRVKKHKETSSRRLLLRNSSTGKLVINFGIHSGMKPSASKQTVSFMGHDDHGVATPFRLRVKTESAAQELKDVLDREIEFVKDKSD